MGGVLSGIADIFCLQTNVTFRLQLFRAFCGHFCRMHLNNFLGSRYQVATGQPSQFLGTLEISNLHLNFGI